MFNLDPSSVDKFSNKCQNLQLLLIISLDDEPSTIIVTYYYDFVRIYVSTKKL